MDSIASYAKKNRNKNKGFTLIELLVVIAIIGLLSTISIIALNQARSKARDARRVADMHQLQTAIEMYYDIYGEYPPISDTDGVGLDYSMDGIFMPNLISAGLIGDDYKDPWNNKYTFYYYWMSPTYSAFSAYCPNPDTKALLWISLENNTPLTGFATSCASQSATAGYRRCICFY